MNAPSNNLVGEDNKLTLSTYLSTEKGKNWLVSSFPDEARRFRFVTNIMALVSSNPKLGLCDKASLMSAALQIESLRFPVSNQLGFAYVVPYGNNAQFQIGWKGLVQLAHRTGVLKKVVLAEIKEGELLSYNPITEEAQLQPIMDENKREVAKTIGYYAKLETMDGFTKELYWSIAKVQKHAKTYSKAYGSGYSFWDKNFDEMGKKTVLKQLLQKWSPMTENQELQKAIELDQAVIKEDGTPDYIDRTDKVEDSPKIANQEVPFPEKEKAETTTQDPLKDF